jgi:hypothetical protein
MHRKDLASLVHPFKRTRFEEPTVTTSYDSCDISLKAWRNASDPVPSFRFGF